MLFRFHDLRLLQEHFDGLDLVGELSLQFFVGLDMVVELCLQVVNGVDLVIEFFLQVLNGLTLSLSSPFKVATSRPLVGSCQA